MLIDGDFDRSWKTGERRRTEFVIIGRDLDTEALRSDFSPASPEDGCQHQRPWVSERLCGELQQAITTLSWSRGWRIPGHRQCRRRVAVLGFQGRL